MTASPRVLATRAFAGFGTSIGGRRRASASSVDLGPADAGRISLLIPANAIGAWLGVGLRARCLGADHPDRRASRPGRPAERGRRVLPAHRRRSGTGFRVDRGRRHAADGLGRGRLARGAGPRRGRGGLAVRHRAGRGRSASPSWPPPSSAEGVVFGGERLVHLERIETDPGALLFAGEAILEPSCRSSSCGAASGCAATSRPPAWPSRPRSSIRPVTTLIRELADRF